MMEVRPALTVLTDRQCEQVDTYALEILEQIGIRVDDPAARSLFAENDCPVNAAQRVRIPAERVRWAIAGAPERIEIFDRRGASAFTLDSGTANTPRFGIGVTNLHYQEAESDRVVPFSMDHMVTAVRLGHSLPGFDLVATPGIAQELDSRTADLHAVLAMTANTTKPLVLLVSEEKLFEPVLDLLAELHGEPAERPFAIPYVNPITPLVLNTETAVKIRTTIARGLPLIYSNYGMSGATTPITPGGTLALLTAELLAGLVYTQLLKRGTPVILGSLPAGFDMRRMMSHYTPHTMLLNLACAEMMARYGIPHAGTSGSGAGWGPDLLAAGGFWLNHLTSCVARVGLVPFVGGNFDSLAFSPTAVVLADEVIRLSRIFANGFSLDPQAVGIDEIGRIGPGGNFLTSGLTLQHFRRLPYASPIWPGMTLDQWQASGDPDAGARLRRHTAELLAELTAPPDHEQLIARGERFVRRYAPG